MRLRAELRIRNDRMIEERKRLSLTQADLAKSVDLSIGAIHSLESLHFQRRDVVEEARRVANFLDLPIQEILPDELHGIALQTNLVSIRDVTTDQLVNEAAERRLISAPAEPRDHVEGREILESLYAALENLDKQQREVIKLRWGLPDQIGGEYRQPATLAQIAKQIGVSRERARQIEFKATRRLSEYHVSGNLGQLAGFREV